MTGSVGAARRVCPELAGVLDTLADGALVLLDGERAQGFTFRERGDPYPDGDERADAAAPALAGPATLARIKRLLSSPSDSGMRYRHSLRVEDPRIEPDPALFVLLFRAFDYTAMRQID